MKAVLVRVPGEVGVETVNDPIPARNDVVVRVRGCGICGTDLHLLSGELGSDRFPVVPGHEPWGEVVALGGDTGAIKVGDIVAVDPSLHCGQCVRCRRGQGNMCETWGAIGATVPGAWAEYVAVPATNAHVLPDGFPLEVAALIEPVACAVRGLVRLDPLPDQPITVFGAGTMGVILALLLRFRGSGPVTIVEPNDKRRVLAERLTGAVLVSSHEELPGRAPAVIEASGNPVAFDNALASVDRGGSLLVFGVADPAARVAVSPHRIYADELSILGSMAILRSFAPAIDAVGRNAPALAPLITDRLPLESIGNALAAVSTGQALKVVLDPSLVGVEVL